MEVSEQRMADQRRTVVIRGLLSKSWLEEFRTQIAETFKETNENTEEERTQIIDDNRESRSLENPQTAETQN
jgi:hypothetical protein